RDLLRNSLLPSPEPAQQLLLHLPELSDHSHQSLHHRIAMPGSGPRVLDPLAYRLALSILEEALQMLDSLPIRAGAQLRRALLGGGPALEILVSHGRIFVAHAGMFLI